MNLDLSPGVLLNAYCQGIFPMGDDFGNIRWYSPDPRCIFDFDHFHVPKRLARTYRKKIYECRVNTAWSAVMQHCADRPTTWISEEIFEAYTRLHQLGFAHSVEAYLGDELVGGLYGVAIGGAFMGESMFSLATDASKVCLIYLVERMQERGYVLLDTQFMTSHLRTLGAINISRQEYLERLQRALQLNCKFA